MGRGSVLSRRLTGSLFAIMVGVAGVLCAIPSSHAQVDESQPAVLQSVVLSPSSGSADAVTPSAAYLDDAVLTSQILDVDVATAAGYQATANLFENEYTQNLVDLAGDRLAGVYTPEGAVPFSPHIRISGASRNLDLEAVAQEAANRVGVQVTIEYVNAPPLEAMTAAISEYQPVIRDLGDGIGDISVDETTSQVRVEFDTRQLSVTDVDSRLRSTLGVEDVPYRIDAVDHSVETTLSITGGASSSLLPAEIRIPHTARSASRL